MPITSYDTWNPRTWVAGEDVTASMMNTLKTHLNALRNQHFLTEVSRGAVLRVDPTSPLYKVTLERFDEIVMSDGTRHNNFTAPLTADITVNGANGLDTGVEAASTWYEIHMIAKDDGTKALLLHKAPNLVLDAAQLNTNSASALRYSSSETKLGQSFQCVTGGVLSYVDVQLLRVGSPSGSVSLELADGSHNLLTTSYPITVNSLDTSAQYIRFVFPTPVTLSASTTYFLQLTGTYTISNSNRVDIKTNTVDSYASGAQYTYNGSTWTATPTGDWLFALYSYNATALTFPSGYTKNCRLGFVYNSGSSNFLAFRALDREVRMSWQVILSAGNATVPTLVALPYVPPVPLLLTLGYTATVSGDVFVVGGVPDGYDPTGGGLGDVSSIQTSNTGLADMQQQMPPVLIDRQGIYYKRLSGTGSIYLYIYGYRW